MLNFLGVSFSPVHTIPTCNINILIDLIVIEKQANLIALLGTKGESKDDGRRLA